MEKSTALLLVYTKPFVHLPQVLPPEFGKKKEPVALERAWRRRKKVFRFGEKEGDEEEEADDGMEVEKDETVEGTEYQDGSDGEYSAGEEGPPTLRKTKPWSIAERGRFKTALLSFGYPRWTDITLLANLNK